MKLLAVNYHYVRPRYDEPHPGVYGITPAQLRTQIEALAPLGTFVSLAELDAAVRGAAALPERAIVLTFDDGFREHVEHALPVLDAMHVPAIFYVNTHPTEAAVVSPHHKVHLLRAHTPPAQFVALLIDEAARHNTTINLDDPRWDDAKTQYRYDEPEVSRLKFLLNVGIPTTLRDPIVDALFARVFPDAEAEMSHRLYCDADQFRLLGDRNLLGNHGHRHLPLGQLSLEEAAHQLDRCRQLLLQWTGRRVETFSYPFGSRSATSSAVGALATQQGYRFGFTMERAFNLNLSEPVHLARFDTNDVPGGKSYTGNAASFFDEGPWRTWYGDGAGA
jgi:peptidoglycan/xylan/chitin deacetylase (PgdA/CDA1 family)